MPTSWSARRAWSERFRDGPRLADRTGSASARARQSGLGRCKNGIRGTYHAISTKWLQSYLDEYVDRYNTRSDETDPFLTLLARATAQ